MPTPTGRILTVNGGSSSIKFALFAPTDPRAADVLDAFLYSARNQPRRRLRHPDRRRT